jgi:hypothetical protein
MQNHSFSRLETVLCGLFSLFYLKLQEKSIRERYRGMPVVLEVLPVSRGLSLEAFTRCLPELLSGLQAWVIYIVFCSTSGSDILKKICKRIWTGKVSPNKLIALLDLIVMLMPHINNYKSQGSFSGSM